MNGNGMKQNRVLQILIGASLMFVLFFGYMLTARDNGTFALADIAGDRAYLEVFAFEGIAGDNTGMVHFAVENGEVMQTYYPTDGEELDKILQMEKAGAGSIRKYFPKDSNIPYNSEMETAPAADAFVQDTTEEELKAAEESEYEYHGRGNRNMPYEFMGIKADKIDLYLRMRDFEHNKETKLKTGVQLTGRDYYYAKWKYADEVYSDFYDAERTVDLKAADLEDAFYVIPATDENCIGEAALYRIEKADMVPYEYREDDRELLYSTQEYGTAEPLCTFPVNAENRILGLTNIGADRLLLSRTENDRLLLELYDLNGNLLFRKDTDIAEASGYEFDTVQLLEKEENAVLWVELMREIIDEEDPDQSHYFIEGGRYFVIADDTIEMLSETKSVDYLDYTDGTYLKLKYESPLNENNIVKKFWGSNCVGYDIQVVSEKTGTVLYHGKLETDFEEDDTKLLSRINIGQYQEPLEDRAHTSNIFGERAHLIFKRGLGKALPLRGTLKPFGWSENTYMEYGLDNYYY